MHYRRRCGVDGGWMCVPQDLIDHAITVRSVGLRQHRTPK